MLPETAESPAASRTYELRSRKHLDINLDEVMSQGRLTVFPHVIENSKLLALSFVQNKIRLSAGAYIGLIPLAPGVLIDVRPKLPVSNLAHVLDVARHRVETLAGVERLYLATDVAGDSVVEFLTRNLLDAIKAIQAAGWLKEYVQRLETTSQPKGRIDLPGTLAYCWSRGASHRVRTKSFTQTVDVPANRLLRHILETLLLSRRAEGDGGGLMAEANRILEELPSSIGQMALGDRVACEAIVRRRSMPSTRPYYYRALEIGLLILEGRGISFQSEGDDITLATSIIDFEKAFESYIRRVLQLRAGASVAVQDGNMEGKRPLYDGQRRGPPAQPDIVLLPAAGGQPVVADVKYKDSPARQDVEQVVTYALVYRARRVVIIHQNEPTTACGLMLIGNIGHVEVYAYAMNLDARDLSIEEEKMSKALFGLIV